MLKAGKRTQNGKLTQELTGFHIFRKRAQSCQRNGKQIQGRANLLSYEELENAARRVAFFFALAAAAFGCNGGLTVGLFGSSQKIIGKLFSGNFFSGIFLRNFFFRETFF